MIVDGKIKRIISPELRAKKRIIALRNLDIARKSGKLGKHGKYPQTLLKENIEKELRDNLVSALLPFIPELTYEILFQALNGDTKTAQYIFNQLIGRPKETIEQTGSTETLKSIEVGMRELLSKE